MKKVLSIVLALAMIFSVCAFSASAVVEDAFVAINVKADGTFEKGDTVTFDVYFEANNKFLGKLGACEVSIGYDSSVFELVDDISSKPALTDLPTFVIGDGYGLNGKLSLANSFVDTPSKTLTDGDKAKGWDTLLGIHLTQDGDYVDCASETKMFGFKLKVKEDAADDGSYVVGVAECGINDTTTYVCEAVAPVVGTDPDEYWGESTGLAKCIAVADATVNVATAPEKLYITHEGTQSKWANGTPVAADYLFGFLAKIDGIGELATTKDDATGKTIVNDIASITATAVINGVTKTDDVQSIWVDGTGYKFRAKFAGFTPDMNDEVSVTFVITMTDGTTVYETADAATATINGIYLQSVSNGLAELA